MATFSARKLLFGAGLLGCAVLAWGLASSRGGQSKGGAQAGGPTPGYFGVSACVNCHTKPPPGAPPLLCRCIEAEIWDKEDKHKNAYNVLKEERAKNMGKILKLDVANEKSCIGCHGVYIEDKELAKSSQENGFKLEDGVSCVACHGAFLEWVDFHGGPRRPAWRKMTRTDKETKFGMTDLWDPAKRTKLCVSCHIGNTEEGKVVTHEMYAAGHPPLPGIEMAKFSDVMPKHWQYLSEKSDEAKKLLDYKAGTLERTQLVVVSGAASLRDAMHLLATQAQEAAKAPETDKRVLNVAQFDCYACHHELKRPSWRQERGFPSKPGRPQPREWPLALVRLGMRHVNQDEAPLKEKLAKLHQAFDIQPFGKPEDVAAAAQEVADWANKLAADVAGAKYDQAAARSLLDQLCQLVQSQTPDYDTAREFAWAFQIIYSDLSPKPAKDAQIQQQLKSLNDQLKLELPATQKVKILEKLPEALQKIDNYGPKEFKQTFAELAKQLHAP
jgi:hypothetical protein